MWAGTRFASRPIWKLRKCCGSKPPNISRLRSLDRILAEAWHAEQWIAARDCLFRPGRGTPSSLRPARRLRLHRRSPVLMPTRPPPTSATSISRDALSTRWSIVSSIPLRAVSSTLQKTSPARKLWEYWARGASRFRILRLPREIPWPRSLCSGCTPTPIEEAIATRRNRRWS